MNASGVIFPPNGGDHQWSVPYEEDGVDKVRKFDKVEDAVNFVASIRAAGS